MADITPQIEDDPAEIVDIQDTDSDEDDDPFAVDDSDEENQQSGKLGKVENHNKEIAAPKKLFNNWSKVYRTGDFPGENMVDLNQLPCSYCEFVTTTVNSIKQHIRKCHRDKPISYQCSYCSYKCIGSIKSLKIHILSHHTAESDIQWFRCNQCEFKAKLKDGLQRHILCKHTDSIDRMNKCKKCPKMFKRLSHVKRHELAVHEKHLVTKVKCSQCDYECVSSQQLQNHLNIFHSDFENLETLQCPECSYTTKFKIYLNNHVMRNHRDDYQCEKCPYHTRILAHMRLHSIKHEEVKDDAALTYHCDKCPYKTYRHYSLKVHKLNHLKPEEIQYFHCYHCNFKAKRKDNLKTHVLKHFKWDEVTLACYICEFTTVKRHLLIRHIDEHSKEMSKTKKMVSALTLADKKPKEVKKCVVNAPNRMSLKKRKRREVQKVDGGIKDTEKYMNSLKFCENSIKKEESIELMFQET